jgi:hypothetical protein
MHRKVPTPALAALKYINEFIKMTATPAAIEAWSGAAMNTHTFQAAFATYKIVKWTI